MHLSGKRVLVTGGTDGIGAALIRALRDVGAEIITTGRTAERIAATRADGFEVIEADLSAPAGIEAVIAGLGDRPIDILVNNAGAGVSHDFRHGTPDETLLDPGIFLNLNAPIHLITRLLPVLMARPEAMVVNVTSGLAIAPYGGGPVYCATKAGLRSYGQALRRQLKGTRVQVLEALPPLVATQMNAGRSKGLISAEECARQIVRAMEQNAAEANIGLVKVLRLIYSISPALARVIMIRA
ncbi:SDR family NAD(P)-dependent oxidoreductase [Novosphingobium sp. G106]|uniref:SDR family oxidoreductase n=1 Tax=Novosphingobium sp. G106 TaxID=2849500 RepID=UPI001C2DC48D|nr:SDR family NAD(P)-dependent oxidoreductase [Novosphingobium sp. G106]MBV1687006.1 SDR family NAD(P)-dependent oxidoreductase [Novosphingobium sp. G106]